MQSTKADALPTVSTGQVLDREALIERMDGDTELLAELVEIFVEDCPRLIADARGAIAVREADAVVMAAHTIKGSVSNFCARATFDAAYTLERLGREGIARDGAAERWADAQAALVALETEIERLLPVLRALAQDGDPCKS